MALFIVAVIVFIIVDIFIRVIIKYIREKNLKAEREKALTVDLKIDYTTESKTLKRVEVPDPKARILCVDDESIVLDSFRKILVLEGYNVDTVETGQEALGLIQKHSYDFVFTDLKMPRMDGVEVTKAVKHLRPDIDVVIITGYATVQTAVECMKLGAMDYVEKPFTEDELISFTNKLLIKRKEKIKKQLKPKVHITHFPDTVGLEQGEFAIPGGVFLSDNHTWIGLDEDGLVKVGIDDFAKKLIGKVDNIEFPNLGMEVMLGQNLFSIKQGIRSIQFTSPISGKVVKINKKLAEDMDKLDITPYERNWICTIDASNLDSELVNLKIGRSAISLYEDDLQKCESILKELFENNEKIKDNGRMFIGIMQNLDDNIWNKIVNKFFLR